MAKSRTSKAKPAKSGRPRKKAVKTLDEKTSAFVLAEYLGIEDVDVQEINAIVDDGVANGYRGIAITFRVSEVLGVPDCFEIAPRFRTAFERARALMRVCDAARRDREQPEAVQ